MKILFITDGAGSGHAKRISAILRGFIELRVPLNKISVYSPRLLNRDYVKFPVQYITKLNPSDRFDVVFLDQRISTLPQEALQFNALYVQPCKEVCERQLPEIIREKTLQISIEICSANIELNMPYFGVLLDASENEILSRERARANLHNKFSMYISDKDILYLIMVNTSEREAALSFCLKGLQHFNENENVVISSTYANFIGDRIKSPKVKVIHIENIVRYLNAFDSIYAPSSYNSYYEILQFYQGEVKFESIFDYEMPLRLARAPAKSNIGNIDFVRHVVQFLGYEV